MSNIRKASQQDEELISRLLKQKYSFQTLEEARDALIYEMTYNHFRVAEENGHIIGLISWRPQGTYRHGVAEVTRLAVLSGLPNPVEVKELLFDAMIAEADLFYRGHGSRLRKVFSIFHADNEHLKRFFANKGMEEEAVLRSHFRFGVDEVVYSMFVAT